jgi:hypothetical protein
MVCEMVCKSHVCTICNRTCILHVCTICNRICDLPICIDCGKHPDNLYINTDNATNGYIELHNPTDKSISAKGLFLTDGNGFTWKLPAVILRQGDKVRIGIKGNDVNNVLKRMWIDIEISSVGELKLVGADEME